MGKRKKVQYVMKKLYMLKKKMVIILYDYIGNISPPIIENLKDINEKVNNNNAFKKAIFKY